MTEHYPSLRFRPLRVDDLELVLAWRSHPKVYEQSREQDGPLEWAEHLDWFAGRPPDRHDFVIEYRGRRVGVVSIDEDGEVGVYVGEVSSSGRGIGSRAVEWICDQFAQDRDISATVNGANESSRRLFETCGFTADDRSGEWITYRFESEG